ncbi:F-box/WD repeat-containing protein 7 [Lucilia sericata]|uniref:F-box/WD repeat-containing protein 7 n=1 Tax=Lucilia sericata TaxID=13632 RepID=UPI0018A82F47|nr:F-box/WD repeat-containing protein 7 [Lucilia sericata]XP_037824485.1 F-box/WD repeat-containing protein 7 [Lucilia sericata]
MEEKCIDQFETVALNLTKTSSNITTTITPSNNCSNKTPFFITSSSSSSTSSTLSSTSNGSRSSTDQISLNSSVDKEDFDKATTSRSSMSLLQEEFETNSQHDFAEVLDEDDETTTSGVLEAYEISSSNLLPTTNDDVTSEPVAVVDDSSSTDAIQIIKVSDASTESAASNNGFFNPSEIYVINDDDDDEEEDDEDDDVDEEEDVVNEAEDDDDVEEIIEGNLINIDDNLHIEEDEDDDDVEDAEDEEEECDMNITNQSSQRSTQNTTTSTQDSSTTQNQTNGVIMSTNGAMIFLETPVVEEQQHHHHHHLHHSQITNSSKSTSLNEFANENNMKPKRLSDEFSKNSANTNETPTSSTAASSKLLQESNDMIYDLTESQPCPETQAHERMSSRLKKMNLNHGNTNNNINSQDLPTSSSSSASNSSSILMPSLSDIESMDLIERRDFEHEQRLTGGIILKSSSLIKNNVLDLGLVKSQQQQQQQKNNNNNANSGEEQPSSSHSRGFSSDSKCTYKDLSATPTSSRKLMVRLTKSTAKMNLCNTLSHNQPQQQPQSQQQQAQELTTKTSQRSSTEQQQQIPKSLNLSANSSSLSSTLSASSSSTNSSSLTPAIASSSASGITANSTSVIVEAASSHNSEIYSNSNSNDSLTSRPSSTSSTLNKRPEVLTQEQKVYNKHSTVAAASSTSLSATNSSSSTSSISSTAAPSCVLESGCSRTSAIQPIVNNSNHNSNSSSSNEAHDDDVQPSTSSARCQYAPPPRSQRQVNASAQTSERYLSRSNAIAGGAGVSANASNDVCLSAAALPSRSGSANHRRSEISQNLMDGFRMLNEHLDNNFTFNHQNTSWNDCEENNSDIEEICTCHQNSMSDGSSHGGSISDLNDVDELDGGHVYGKDGGADLSYNIMHNLSISEDAAASPECVGTRKRKYTDTRLMEHDYNSATITGSGGTGASLESNSRKRVAYDFTSTPRSSQVNAGALVHISTPSQLLATSSTGSPLGRRTPRSLIPTRDNPPPELQQWLSQFQRWSHAERLLAVDRLIEHCEPTQVRHMMKVIEPQFQRDFISLLPRELALQVLSYLDPKDLLRAAQTCRSWRFLCDDNLLWKEKCRQAQILTEPRTDRPKRGRAGNMPPIASPWKAAYMRQHIIEMNWRSRPIRQPKVLKGHDEHVITCLQFSGNRIVSGSDDNTLKVWSAVTGRCLRTLVGHTGGVWSSQMSGNIIISGSTDRTLKVWDMETGQCVHTLLGHTSTVRCMHLHGNKVVSGSRDATLRVWDIEQGTCLRVLVGHLAAVRCVQYDGKLIVSGAYDYMVKIWHPERPECLHTLQGHTNRVYSLQFDGIHVVSGSLDTSIRVWDVETGNCKHTLMGHQSLTSGMELRENILVSGNADSTVKVWDITTGQCLQTLSGSNKHQSAVTCLQFNSRFVVTSSDDGTVKLWDVKTGEFIRNLVSLDSGGSGGVVWRIRANDTKLICAVGSRNGTEETKLMVLDFDVEGACVKCS